MARIISKNSNEVEEVDANASKHDGETKGHLKKGPWTPAEDSILIEYVKKYGEGNWNSVQKNSGLARCGKSCRLRWANHLRPNLKKGAFSQAEEQIIIELHAKLGNKWARMAAQLPGRTDNEIKNFWNTRMKRRQRAGMPLYPPEIIKEAASYHLEQQHYFAQQPHCPSSSAFSSLLTSCYPPKLNEPSHYFAMNSLQNQPTNSSCYTNPCSEFKFSNENSGNGSGNIVLPLSPPVSQYGSSMSSSTLFNHSFGAHNYSVINSYDYPSGSYNYGFNSNDAYEPLPSSQSPPGSLTSASSYASGVDGLMGKASSMANSNDYYEIAQLSPQENSGLLDALVMEGQVLSRNDKPKSEDSTIAGNLSYKRKSVEVDEEYAEEGEGVQVESTMKKNNGETTNESTKKDDFSSSQLSIGKKVIGEDPLEEMNSMDDDLFSLLDSFPSEMPMPEWYRKGGESQSLGLETQPDANLPGPTHQEFAWTLGTCWNNMPGIC